MRRNVSSELSVPTRRESYTLLSRDAYVACCTFTDKFKPGLYRDDHCLSSFLKLMPSVEYLKKYDYVACSCDDRSCLTDWVYIFDETSRTMFRSTERASGSVKNACRRRGVRRRGQPRTKAKGKRLSG